MLTSEPNAKESADLAATTDADEPNEPPSSRVLDVLQLLLPTLSLLAALGFDRTVGLDLFPAQKLAIILGLTLAYVYVKHIGVGWARWSGWIGLGAGLVSIGYLTVWYEAIYRGAGTPTTTTIILGILLVASLLEAVRRVYGPGLAAIFVGLSLYPLVAPYLPGLLQAREHPISRIVVTYYTQRDGIFGAPIDVAVSVVSVFIILGALFTVLGAGDRLGNFSMWAFGRSRGGPAKVSVVTSGLLGSVSGSASGNVATTGVLTIPLMKRIGFSSPVAGAVESTASTGGLLMPPIMGAAAFIMAEFLSIPYAEIALAALVPAVLYYLALFIIVHLEAKRSGIAGMDREELPPFREGWQALYLIGVPIAVLVVSLLIRRDNPAFAGTFSIVSLIAVATLSRRTRPRPRRILKAVGESAAPLASIILIVAAAGLAVGAVAITGLGAALVQAVFTLAGTSLVLALLLTALASIALGMSMPAVGVYVILAMIVTPGLVELGITPLAAHMFVYYFGILSFITPPVCIAVYMAASISGAKPMPTALQSMRLGFVAYLIPFVMVYNPAIMLAEGTVGEQLASIAIATVAVSILAIVLGRGVQRMTLRIGLAGSAVALLVAGSIWNGTPL